MLFARIVRGLLREQNRPNFSDYLPVEIIEGDSVFRVVVDAIDYAVGIDPQLRLNVKFRFHIPLERHLDILIGNEIPPDRTIIKPRLFYVKTYGRDLHWVGARFQFLSPPGTRWLNHMSMPMCWWNTEGTLPRDMWTPGFDWYSVVHHYDAPYDVPKDWWA